MSLIRSKPLKSLKGRLALWVLLPIVLISSIDLILTYQGTDHIATLVQEQLLKGSAKIISEQLATVDGSYEISIPPAAFELFASDHQDRVFYSVHSKSGLLIAGDGQLPYYRGPLQTEQEKYFLATIRGEAVRVIAYKHALPSTTSGDYAVTQIAQTLRSQGAFRNELFALTIREHLILLSIMVVGLVITFRWTLRPMIQFGETLLQRQPGSLERLDDRNAPAELAPIIFAMNDYVARLDKTLGAYEQFVANTAHHLRTTFAILTSQINFGLRDSRNDQSAPEILGAMRRTVAQGSKVINQLLMLASVEQDQAGRHGIRDVKLADTVKDVMEELAPLAQQRHIELGIDCVDEDIYLRAPPHLLREVLANLLDNSMQHMKQPGSVTVLLSRQAQSVLLRVTDTGPGIPAEERLKVFERFYRLDRSKTGSSGLGLAIVKEICDALHAQVTLAAPACGSGLQVDIVFPSSD